MFDAQDQPSTSTKRHHPLFNYSATNNPGSTLEIQKIMSQQSETFLVKDVRQPSSWVVPPPLMPELNNDTGKTYTQPSVIKENLSVDNKEVERNDELPSDISDWVIEHKDEIEMALQQLVGSNVVSEIIKEQTSSVDKDLEALFDNIVNNNQHQDLNVLNYLVCSTPSPDNLICQELNNHVQIIPGSMTSDQISVVSDLNIPGTPVLSPDNYTKDQNHIHLTEPKPIKSVSSGDQILSAFNISGPLTNLNIPSTVEEKFIALEEDKDPFNMQTQKTLGLQEPSSDHLIGQELNHVEIAPESITSNQIPVVSDFYEPVTPVLSPGNHTEDQNQIHLTELKPINSVSSGYQILSAFNFPALFTNLIIPSTVKEKSIGVPLEVIKDSFNIQTQKTPSPKRSHNNFNLDLKQTNVNKYEFYKPNMEEVDLFLDSQSASIDDNSNSTSSSKDGDWESTSNKRARLSIIGRSSNGKREKNKDSSKRSREKKVQIEKANEEKCKQLDIENKRLKIKSKELKEEIDDLYKHQSNLLLHLKELLKKKF